MQGRGEAREKASQENHMNWSINILIYLRILKEMEKKKNLLDNEMDKVVRIV